MSSIEVVAGLVLIILFYSLLAAIIMELISGFFALRGKRLEKVLKSMLSSNDRREEVFEDFTSNILYEQLSGRALNKKSPPSYMSAATFRSILLTVIEQRQKGDTLPEKIAQLPDDKLRVMLQQLMEESGYEKQTFFTKIETWFNDVMDRASGWYKRNIEKSLLILGFLIAATFNVDTLSIFTQLVSHSRFSLDKLVALADAISEKEIYIQPADTLSLQKPETVYLINEDIKALIDNKIQQLQNPLGVGWKGVEPSTDIFFWLSKLFGWLITAIGISKGATFWFDLLKKMMNFRSVGKTPVEATLVQRVTPAAEVAPIPQATMEIMPKKIKEAPKEMIDKPVG